MKTKLLLFTTLFALTACEDEAVKRKDEVYTVTIDGCQYLAWTDAVYGVQSVRQYIHKGNCTNHTAERYK